MSAALRIRPLIRLALLAAAVVSAACGASVPYTWVHDLPVEKQVARTTAIALGDVVEIRVFGQDSLTTRGAIREDGTLTVPLLGPVRLLGQEPTAAAAMLQDRLKPFVVEPRVTVVVVQSVVTITAIGEVMRVGALSLEAPATVLQALAAAGGLDRFADRSGIYVIRQADGKSRRIRFTYASLVAGEPAAAAFRLKSGDVLFVED